ncbi:MAG: hypothetical protein ACREQ5_14600 [Candidatus Dormibacteria bacterium]
MMKSNSIMSVEINASIGEITFSVTGIGQTVLHMGRVHKDNVAYAALHGFKQRIADAAALGQLASRKDKLAAMQELVEYYETGAADWRIKGAIRTTGGELGLLVQCLMELQPEKTKDELTAWTKSKTAEQRASLLVSPKIKAIADRIRESLAGETQADDLLAELGIAEDDEETDDAITDEIRDLMQEQ